MPNDEKESSTSYSIKDVESPVSKRHMVNLSVENECLGYMEYSINKSYITINRIINETKESLHSWKYVGSILFEYAFHVSMTMGKGGNIILDATRDSPIAFYKMGFRKMSFYGTYLYGTYLHELVTQYNLEKTDTLKKKITEHEDYKKLATEAAFNLNKKIDEVNFDEIVAEGMYCRANKDFSRELSANKNLDGADCYRLKMRGSMSLPSEIIAEKKKLFYDKDQKRKYFYTLKKIISPLNSLQTPICSQGLFAQHKKPVDKTCCSRIMQRIKAFLG